MSGTKTLSPTGSQPFWFSSYLLGVVVRSILILRHKPSTPYNFNIQFPIYIKFLTHVEGVAPITPMHQYQVGHFDFGRHFKNISLSRTLTNTPYRLNTTDVTFTQYHPQTLKIKIYHQKLSPPSNMVAMVMRFISPEPDVRGARARSSLLAALILFIFVLWKWFSESKPSFIWTSMWTHTGCWSSRRVYSCGWWGRSSGWMSSTQSYVIKAVWWNKLLIQYTVMVYWKMPLGSFYSICDLAHLALNAERLNLKETDN